MFRNLVIAACLFAAGAAQAQPIDLATTPETRKAMEDAVKAMGERRNVTPTPLDVLRAQRAFCMYGRPNRALTAAECKREFAMTRRIFRTAGPGSNLGVSVTNCSDYCHAQYPNLPGYYQ